MFWMFFSDLQPYLVLDHFESYLSRYLDQEAAKRRFGIRAKLHATCSYRLTIDAGSTGAGGHVLLPGRPAPPLRTIF